MMPMPQSSWSTVTLSEGPANALSPASTSPRVVTARKSTGPESLRALQVNRRMFDAPVTQTRLSGRMGWAGVAATALPNGAVATNTIATRGRSLTGHLRRDHRLTTGGRLFASKTYVCAVSFPSATAAVMSLVVTRPRSVRPVMTSTRWICSRRM